MSLFQRILTYAVVTAALFLITVAWIESWEEFADDVRPKVPGQLYVSDGYRLDRIGRRLSDGAKTDEDRKEAEEKYLEALDIFRQLNLERGEAEVLNDLGLLYVELRQYPKAVECYERSLEIKRKVGWAWGEGNSLANLGQLYSKQGEYAKAVDHAEQAVKAYEKANDQKAIGRSFYELANIYEKVGQIPKAIESL